MPAVGAPGGCGIASNEEDTMRRIRSTRLAIGLFAVALLVAACSSDDGGGDDTGGGDTGGGGGGSTITIEGNAYDPSTIEVSGSTTLTVVNNDGVDHTLTLDDDSAEVELAGGESGEITVDIAESTGFHCEIHPSMTGTFEVA
jgi:plastocyanin